MNDPYQQYHQYYGLPAPPPPYKDNTLKIVAVVVSLLLLFIGCTVYLLTHGLGRRGFVRGMYNGYIAEGDAKYSRGDYQGAVDSFTFAVDLEPDKSIGYTHRGNAKVAMKRYDDAIADYSHALNVLSTPAGIDELGDPGTSQADKVAMLPDARAIEYYNLGLAYADKRDYASAIVSYTSALTDSPYYFDAYSNRAFAYAGLRRWDLALADATFIVQKKPGDADARVELAEIYAAKGDARRTFSEYMLAITLKPQALDYYQRLGYLSEQGHRFDDSVACWQTAAKNNPTNAICWANLGWAQYLDGKVQASIVNSKKAISIDGNCSSAYLNAGLAYAVLGDWNHARPIYQAVTDHARASDFMAGLDDVHNALKTQSRSTALRQAEAFLTAAARQNASNRPARRSG